MINYANDFQYAREKLVDSFVVYENDIVHILDIDDEGHVEYRTFDGEHNTCFLGDINTEPPRLGYINQGRIARFVTRTPARHYRQGFRRQTLRQAHAVKGNHGQLRIDRGFALAHRNFYPSVEDCVENISNEEVLSSAFSKKFAIFKKKTNLYFEYKGREVGTVNDDSAKLILHNQFMFLEEVLKECL